MRTIGELEKAEQRNKKMARNFALFFLGMLVISSLGYAFMSNPNAGNTATTQTNSGVTQVGNKWVFGQAGSEVVLSYGPDEVENISVWFIGSLNDYVQEPLFLDITNPGVLSEVSQPFTRYASRMQEACYGNCSRDLPEKNCTENMIVFKESIDNLVWQKDKCVFIEGDLRAADAFIYKAFGMLNS